MLFVNKEQGASGAAFVKNKLSIFTAKSGVHILETLLSVPLRALLLEPY